MFGFGDEEEETPTPQAPQLEPWKQELLKRRNVAVGPQVAQANPGVVQKKLDEIPVAETYDAIKADDSKINDAKAAADKDNLTSSIFQGISTAFAGPKYTNDSFYDGIRKRSDGKVDTARNEKQELIKNYLQKNDLKRQEVKDGQDATMFGLNTQKAGLDIQNSQFDISSADPNSKTSNAYRPIIAKKMGLSAEKLAGVSYDDMLKMLNAHNAGLNHNGPTKNQIVETKGADGNTVYTTINPVTRAVEGVRKLNPATGQYEEIELPKSYAPVVNNATGTIAPRAIGGEAQPIKTVDGQNLVDVQTGRKAIDAAAVDTAQAGVKADVAVAGSQAAENRFNAVESQINDLLPKAEADGVTGPIAGRLTEFAVKNNLPVSEAATQLDTLMQREGAAYVRDISGLSSTDQEFQRLMSSMPRPLVGGKGDPAFQGKMAAWKADVGKAKKLKEDTRDLIKANSVPTQAATTPPAKTVVKTEKNKKTGQTRYTYSDGSTEVK
jgi:hypothetical protein